MFPSPNENGTLSVHRILLSVMSVRMYFTTDTSVRRMTLKVHAHAKKDAKN
jgi:hypothetical protein